MFIPLSLLLVFATLSGRIFVSFRGHSCNETNIPILPSYNYQSFLRNVFFSAFDLPFIVMSMLSILAFSRQVIVCSF